MVGVLDELDREWAVLAGSPRAARAVRGWGDRFDALAGLDDLAGVLVRRDDPVLAPGVLGALAALAPVDELAARALLQALVPGIVCLARRAGDGDRAAVEEMVSLAWERIRTYPPTRTGSVAGNVLLDVRKRYWAHRAIDVPRGRGGAPVDGPSAAAGPEELVLGKLLVEAIGTAAARGEVDADAVRLILRTRLLGESVWAVAAADSLEAHVVRRRRWRGERRLRDLRFAG